MNGYELSRFYFAYKFENPNKLKSNHTELYFYIVNLWNRLGQKPNFGLPTSVTMECLGIGSYNTYKKTLNDLIEFGFIKIVTESKNQHNSKIIALSFFDKALDKALDKATAKATDKALDSIIEQRNIVTKEQINNTDFVDVDFLDTNELHNDTQRIVPTLRKQQKNLNSNIQEARAEIIQFSFDDFWELYPNKANKKKAKDAFNKLNKTQRGRIELHLPYFIQNKPFASYIYPHATTYINQERYNDEIPLTYSTNLNILDRNELERITAEIRSRNPRL